MNEHLDVAANVHPHYELRFVHGLMAVLYDTYGRICCILRLLVLRYSHCQHSISRAPQIAMNPESRPEARSLGV